MKASEIAAALDMMVKIDGKTKGQIIGYTAGWVEVELADTSVIKCRAKQLTLIPGQAPVDTGMEDAGAELPVHTEKVKKETGEEGIWEVKCPNCEHSWETQKSENYICPKCRTKFVIRLHPDKDKYVIGLGETASGRDTMDIDDKVAGILRGLTLDELYEKATEWLNKNIDPKNWLNSSAGKAWGNQGFLSTFLHDRYSRLNPGMQRMSVGNLLRGAIKRQIEASEEAKEDK
ncbi:hypothetical protein KAR91_14555 [Candidatus Pacearchaeota archaeon]|nr:hypothetical protein [Candidatus Pacearchaeota archaeon]